MGKATKIQTRRGKTKSHYQKRNPERNAEDSKTSNVAGEPGLISKSPRVSEKKSELESLGNMGGRYT